MLSAVLFWVLRLGVRRDGLAGGARCERRYSMGSIIVRSDVAAGWVIIEQRLDYATSSSCLGPSDRKKGLSILVITYLLTAPTALVL